MTQARKQIARLRRKMLRVTGANQPGIKARDIIKSSDETNSISKMPGILRNWLSVYDEFLSYFASIANLFFYQAMASEPVADIKLRAHLMLTGAIVNQLIAIRRLVTSGLDNPAKQILRCLNEYVEVAIVSSTDEKLIEEFVHYDGVDEAKKFWNVYLRASNGKKLIPNRFRALVTAQVGESGLEQLRLFDTEEDSILNAVIHPSYAGSSMSVMSGILDYNEMSWPPYFGLQNSFSIRTLKYAIYKLTLYVALVDLEEFCLKLPETPPGYTDQQSEAYRELIQDAAEHVLYGKAFLIRLALMSLWNTNDQEFEIPPVPEFMGEDDSI